MTLPVDFEELTDLVWALVNDRLDAPAADRLQELLDADAANRRVYIELMDQFASLEWEKGNGQSDQSAVESSGFRVPGSDPVIAPIILTTLPSPLSPLPSLLYSYMAAAVIVGIGLLIAWAWKLPGPAQVVQQAVPSPSPLAPSPSSRMQFVGRITGMVDCRWSDPTTAVPGPVAVPLGRKYALSSGLLEITYDSGAKVILQGPVTYEVESRTGGYLSVGKLTARMEKPVVSGQWSVASESKTSKSQIPSPKSESESESNPQSLIPNPSSLSTTHYPLFTIKTPSATVTDLGTEFGVEVDKQGRTESHVFQGTVELRVHRPGGNKDEIIVLSEHESVRVEADADMSSTVRHIAPKPEEFVHRLLPPRRLPIDVFNTGIGLTEGQTDPHWQLVAVSNEPDFMPRPAFVSPDCAFWLKNEPERSQWISIVGDGSAVPNGITYTFRASFELAGVRPTMARLHVRFMADNCVRTIRFNGRKLPVPQHNRLPPYDAFHSFTVTNWFVEGTNVLEFDVENINELSSEQLSADPMGLRVELEGTAVQQHAGMQRSP